MPVILFDRTVPPRAVVRGIGRASVALMRAHDAGPNGVRTFVRPNWQGRGSEFAATAAGWLAARRLSHGVDCFHAATPALALPNLRIPSVVTVLDTIPLELASYRQSGFKVRWQFQQVREASVVMAISHFVASKVHALLDVPTGRIVVVPLPAPVAATRRESHTGETRESTYVTVCVDRRSFDPRKRAEWIVSIARKLRESDIRVVAFGPGTEAWNAPNVNGLGKLTDESRDALLAGATAHLCTSSYEGQGLPQLEAMAAGTPVVAMANTATTELVDGAGILIDESEPDPIGRLAAAIQQVASDAKLASELRDRGWARAAEYSEERFTRGVAAAINMAVRA